MCKTRIQDRNIMSSNASFFFHRIILLSASCCTRMHALFGIRAIFFHRISRNAFLSLFSRISHNKSKEKQNTKIKIVQFITMKLPTVCRNQEELELNMTQQQQQQQQHSRGGRKNGRNVVPRLALADSNPKPKHHLETPKFSNREIDSSRMGHHSQDHHDNQSFHSTLESCPSFYDMRDPPTSAFSYKSTPLRIGDYNDNDDNKVYHETLLCQNSLLDLEDSDKDVDNNSIISNTSSSTGGGIDKENQTYNTLVDQSQEEEQEQQEHQQHRDGSIFRELAYDHDIIKDGNDAPSLSTMFTTSNHQFDENNGNASRDDTNTNDVGFHGRRFRLKPRLHPYNHNGCRHLQRNEEFTLKRSHAFDTEEDYECDNDNSLTKHELSQNNNHFDQDEQELSFYLRHASKRIHLSDPIEEDSKQLTPPMKFSKSSPPAETLQIPSLVKRTPSSSCAPSTRTIARNKCHQIYLTKRVNATWAA